MISWICHIHSIFDEKSDAFIFALLSRRENEMRTYWSPTGYSITVDLRMIKQVRKISQSKIEIAAASAENVCIDIFLEEREHLVKLRNRFK